MVDIVADIVTLRLTEPTTAQQLVYVTEYLAGSVTGGGFFQYDSLDTTSLDDGGIVIVTTGNYRWKRVINTYIDITHFGAVSNTISGYSAFDNRNAIQSAINWANSIYQQNGNIQNIVIPLGIYILSSTNATMGDGTIYGAWSLQMLSGVRLTGFGTLKVVNSSYGTGAFYRVIGSDNLTTNLLNDVEIDGITIDGNVSNQIASNQCNNILLECNSNITINNIYSLNANGNAIMLRGSTSNPATNLIISNCTAINVTDIGLQISQFNGIKIVNNYVANCTNNGIDIYGDTGSGSAISNGVNFIISNNTITNCLNGVFPETCAYGVVEGNIITNMTTGSGIHVNRINNQPQKINIKNNIIKTCQYGITVSGVTGGISITDNQLEGISSGYLWLLSSAYVFFRYNTIKINSGDAYTAVIYLSGTTISFSDISSNILIDEKSLTEAELTLIASGTTVSSTGIANWKVIRGAFSSTGIENFASTTAAVTLIGQTTAGTATYTSQTIRYTRIGNLVLYNLSLTWTGHTGTGPMSISGLPYTVDTLAMQPDGLGILSTAIATAGVNTFATGRGNSQLLDLRRKGDGGVLSYPVVTASGSLSFTGSYYAV
jgi:hypothetical protein